MDKLTIGILNAGKEPPTFIRRRIVYGAEQGLHFVVFGSQFPVADHLKDNIRFLPDLNSEPGIGRRAWAILGRLLRHGALLARLYTLLPGTISDRLKLSIRYLPLCLEKQVNIWHVQWISSVLDWTWLRQFSAAPILASARGSDVTISPFGNPPFETKVRACIREADYIHCVSADIARHCTTYGATQAQLFVNYNGIDPAFFQPGNTPKTDFILITTGSLIPRKGVEFQLVILKKLREQGIPATLWVIGNGQQMALLQYQAGQMDLTPFVHFWGSLPEAQVVGLLQQASVYLSTSVAEGLANAVAEAVATGLPVVAFQCEGMPEIIDNGITGHIVPFGDVEQATMRIAELYTHPEQRKNFGLAARSKVEHTFHVAKKTQEMILFLQKIAFRE